jgi:hypothetical protein
MFTSIDAVIDNDDGLYPSPGVLTVKVWDVTNGADLGTMMTNENGHIPGGTLPVDAGTRVRFRVEHDGSGGCGFTERVTI